LIGRVAERSIASVLKTDIPSRVSWVRIPPLPPVHYEVIMLISKFYSVNSKKFAEIHLQENNGYVVKLYEISKVDSDEELIDVLNFDNDIQKAEDACEDFVLGEN
jgi:hypothetical protein